MLNDSEVFTVENPEIKDMEQNGGIKEEMEPEFSQPVSIECRGGAYTLQCGLKLYPHNIMYLIYLGFKELSNRLCQKSSQGNL